MNFKKILDSKKAPKRIKDSWDDFKSYIDTIPEDAWNNPAYGMEFFNSRGKQYTPKNPKQTYLRDMEPWWNTASDKEREDVRRALEEQFGAVRDSRVKDAATYKDRKFYAYDIDSPAERKYYEELLGDIEKTLREYVSPDITILDDTDAEHITVSFNGTIFDPYNQLNFTSPVQRIGNWMDKFGFIMNDYWEKNDKAFIEFAVDPDQFDDEVFENN